MGGHGIPPWVAAGQGGPHWVGQGQAAAAAAQSMSLASHMGGNPAFNHPLYVHPMMQHPQAGGHPHHPGIPGFPHSNQSVSPSGKGVSPVMILQRGQGNSPGGGGGGAHHYKNQKS